MHKPKPHGFVTGLKWSTAELNGKRVWLTVISGSAQPRPIVMRCELSAQDREGGMVLEAFTTDAKGQRHAWVINQSQADNLRLNLDGEFVIPPAC